VQDPSAPTPTRGIDATSVPTDAPVLRGGALMKRAFVVVLGVVASALFLPSSVGAVEESNDNNKQPSRRAPKEKRGRSSRFFHPCLLRSCGFAGFPSESVPSLLRVVLGSAAPWDMARVLSKTVFALSVSKCLARFCLCSVLSCCAFVFPSSVKARRNFVRGKGEAQKR
jgi:hypothetical protein